MAEKKHILLAEDEEHIAKLISFKLSKGGYEVHWVKNGREALDRLSAPSAHAWSLLVLDVMMPILDGWQVLREMRKLSGHETLPVLMLTAKGLQGDVANASELGAQAYLKKPFDPAELLAVVMKVAR